MLERFDLKNEKNILIRAVGLFLKKMFLEKKKELEKMHDDFTIGVFGDCG